MGKKIIITAGPTDERIDDVMQITNKSGGTLACMIAETLLNNPETYAEIDMIYYVSKKLVHRPSFASDKLTFVDVYSAEDMLQALTKLLTENRIDMVVHNAAVGDYKARYSVRGEDLAKEITDRLYDASIQNPKQTDKTVYDIIMDVIRQPKCAADDSGKMSSYEPNLMTMMDLTPKVIGCVKRLSPDTMLIGSKLLDGVSNEHLFEVADKLADTNSAEFIIANDLHRIGNGLHWAMIVGNHRILRTCETKRDIADAIVSILLTGRP